MFNKNYYKLGLFLFSILLLIVIFKWSDYLALNGYVIEKEGFGPIQETLSGSTSHSVNLPLTNTFDCKNFCSPSSRCALTGQQCFTDIDCPGCQMINGKPQLLTKDVRGNDDAGKLTWNQTPQLSSLTKDIGTQAKIYDIQNQFKPPPSANFGVNTWYSNFKQVQSLFNKRYKPPQIPEMPNYDKRYSVTGQLIDYGPLASNAYLS